MTRWTEGQLDLYKSKRQRGTRPPPPIEFHLHVMIADLLKRWCSGEWRYTHLPMGEYRTPETAGRLKRMGVTAGWPDFMFIHVSGRACWLELKRRGEKPSQAQEWLAVFLKTADIALQTGNRRYFCTDSFNDALNWLKQNDIVPSKINQNTEDVALCATTGENAIE